MLSRGRGVRGWGVEGGGGRGYFIHLAIYCTTTWCFALKGLRTMMRSQVVNELLQFSLFTLRILVLFSDVETSENC